MRSASIGTLAASQSKHVDPEDRRSGFTLLEALVALALILGFAAVLGPYLFQARRIIVNTGGRVAAQVLLRTLVEAPFDRSQLMKAKTGGSTGKPIELFFTEDVSHLRNAHRQRASLV